MRSLTEIRFRLEQEIANLLLLALPPRLPASVPDASPVHLPALPDPSKVAARLRTTPFAAECVRLAEEVLKHHFPLLGVTLETGQDIHWRRDYMSGIETGTTYFRRIPYLDVARAGDHKTIWELSRHQHLVLLAQSYLFSGRQNFLDELIRQLEDWLTQNPFQCGMNWTSGLEVAFRSLSWIWIDRLVGDRFDAAFRRRFHQELYRHGRHLEVNLSYYFSPNTHLLGEAVALHALGSLFPRFPHAKRWQQTGARVVRNELDRQVLADGCHFERSTYYHVYALDMFLFHAILLGPHSTDSAVYAEKLACMAVFLNAIIGRSGVLPFIGDDDGGRFFHPYGPRERFGLATLASCGAFLNRPDWIRDASYLDEQAAWWLDPEPQQFPPSAVSHSVLFRDCGLAVMAAEDIQLIVDTGSFGPGRAGHSHADTLGIVVRLGQEQVLIDPGTYTYVANPLWRDRFRGTAAHNTIRIDGLDQAIPAGSFGWQSPPGVELNGWETSSATDVLTATCSFAGLRHRRKVVFHKTGLWIAILDHLDGGSGEHRIEQFWHWGAEVRPVSPRCLQVGEKALVVFQTVPRLFEGGDYGWVSPALGLKLAAPVACVEHRLAFPASLATIIDLSGKARAMSSESLELLTPDSWLQALPGS